MNLLRASWLDGKDSQRCACTLVYDWYKHTCTNLHETCRERDGTRELPSRLERNERVEAHLAKGSRAKWIEVLKWKVAKAAMVAVLSGGNSSSR